MPRRKDTNTVALPFDAPSQAPVAEAPGDTCVWCHGTGYVDTGVMCRTCHGAGKPAMPEPKAVGDEKCAYCEGPLTVQVEIGGETKTRTSPYRLSWKVGAPEVPLCEKCGRAYHPNMGELRAKMEGREYVPPVLVDASNQKWNRSAN